MSINSYTVFESVAAITMVAEVCEDFVNGDIVVNSICRFFAANGADIGYARVSEDGQHRKVKADYNGRCLLDKFQNMAV